MRNRTILTGLTVSLVAVLLLSVTATAEAGGKKPVLKVNTGISIPRGSTAVYLTAAHLYATDGDDSNDTIFYTIKSISNMGGATLTIYGVPAVAGSKFSQTVLVSGFVAVQHNAIAQTSASFTFAVSDDEGNQAQAASNTSPATFFIAITQPANVAPTLTWIEPNGVDDAIGEGESFTLQWDDADPDDNAVVTFYYGSTFASTPIPGSVYEDPDDLGDQMVWDTTGIAAGTYYLCARLTDSVRSVDVWSTFPVTIGSGPAVDGWQPEIPVTLSPGYVMAAVGMDGFGHALAVNQDSPTTWAYTVFDGTSWGIEATAPNIGLSNFLNPQLEANGSGDNLLVWQHNDTRSALYAKFYRSGTAWESATQRIDQTNRIMNTTLRGSGFDVANSDDGTAMVVWVNYSNYNLYKPFIYARLYDGSGWSAETKLSDGLHPAVAADANGNFMLAFGHPNDDSANEGQIFCQLYTKGGGWGPKAQLKTAPDWPAFTFVKCKRIDVEGTGDKKFVAAYCTQIGGTDIGPGQGSLNRIYGRLFNGTGWETEQRLDNGSDLPLEVPFSNLARLSLKMSSNGSALVMFTQLNAAGVEEVWANRYDASGWSLPSRISYPTDDTSGFGRSFLGNGCGLTMDAMGNGIAVFAQEVGPYTEIVKAHYRVGAAWTDVSVLSSLGNAEVERWFWVDGEESGRAMVIWRQETSLTFRSRSYR